jgi:ribose transport system ATP-binding protein
MNVAAEQGAQHIAPHAALPPAMPDEPLLRLNSVGKRFPGVIALQNVSFDVRAGEVHAICGENGAGKSTLMKIVSGQYRPDEGEIYIDGREHHFASTLEAQAAGIAIIHQELNLIPHLSIAENIFLAREPKRGIFIDRARLAADSQAALDRIGLPLKPRTLVGSLSVAQQQMIEIAKALSLNARLLIMDEPTSSLTESETVHLFRIIKELRQAGVGIVYISHRLDELAEIADRVTVLRDGRTISTDDFAATTIEQVVSHMVGRDLDDVFPERKSQPTDEVLLSVNGLKRRDVFGPVSFELRRGEILGFAGLMGSGRTEVARAVFGADPVEAGEVHVARQATLDPFAYRRDPQRHCVSLGGSQGQWSCAADDGREEHHACERGSGIGRGRVYPLRRGGEGRAQIYRCAGHSYAEREPDHAQSLGR